MRLGRNIDVYKYYEIEHNFSDQKKNSKRKGDLIYKEPDFGPEGKCKGVVVDRITEHEPPMNYL